MIPIILAAGESKRLRPLTRNKPKCLLEKFEGSSTLDLIIKSLSKYQDLITRVLVVGGHGFEFLKSDISEYKSSYPDLEFQAINNEEYSTYNNCYSLYLATKIVEEDVIVINSDVIYDPNILKRVVINESSSLVIDNEKALTQEDMKVKVSRGRITEISKELDVNSSEGEYIGISRITEDDIKSINRALEKVIDSDPSQFYERAFNQCLNEIKFDMTETEGLHWIEIDDFKDLNKALKLFHQGAFNVS